MRILLLSIVMAAASELFAVEMTEHQLLTELQKHMARGADGIVAEVRNNQVVLHGYVLTLSDKALAESTVAQHTQLAVINELSISDPHLCDGF